MIEHAALSRSTLAPLVSLSLSLSLAACGRLDTFTLDPDAGPTADATVIEPRPDAGGGGGDAGSVPPPTFVPVDILVVVDNSGSMADKQANLARNFAAFADQVIGVVDYRLAIITTDVASPDGEREGYLEMSFASASPFALQSVDTAACRSAGVAHGCFRGATPVVDSLFMDRPTQLATFAANVSVGTCGAGVEQAFDALVLALDQMGPGECNEGFLRDDANLVILFVSDEEDTSVRLVPEVVDAIAAHKDVAKVRVAAIVGSVDGAPSSCGADGRATCGSVCETPPPLGSQTPCQPGPPTCLGGEACLSRSVGGAPDYRCHDAAWTYWQFCDWCSYYAAPGCCTARAGSGYVELAREVEARVAAVRPDIPVRQCRGLGTRVACLVDTVCQDSFGDVFARIAQELVIPE